MRKKQIYFSLALLAAALVFYFIYFPVLSRYHEMKIQEEQNGRKIRDLEHKVAVLTEEKRLLEEDTEYIEKIIREELGMVRPGEIVYKFVEDHQTPSGTGSDSVKSSGS